MKKNFPTLLLAILLLVLGVSTQAQVIIGSSGKPKNFSVLELVSQYKSGVYGGLRLPQMTTAQRDGLNGALSADAANAKGLMIYNTDVNCVEYWNNAKWIGMCDNKFTNTMPTDSVPSTGALIGPGTVKDGACSTTGNYTFSVVSGSEFATVNVINAAGGSFSLNFSANPNATPRTAVVSIVSPCGNTSIYSYSQKGDPSGCGTTTVPAITSENGFSICAGGAANLTLSGNPTTGTFIWTLNGQQVGTGNHYTATQAGNYIVYGDKIGCPNSQSTTVTQSGSAAPAAVSLVVIGNNGVACGAGGTVTLTATAPAAGTVVWYKDGVKTANTGITVQAGKGTWTAVVENGGCSSAASNAATVTEDNSGGSIPVPTLKINGATSGFTFCQGGSAFLEVGNYDAQYTYTWYADNTQIGTGTGISYSVPASGSVVMRVRVTGTGCAKESSVNQTISAGTPAPAAPQLVGNAALCGGTAALTAQTTASSPVYAWYKDGSQIAGATASTYTATQIGNYGVTVTSSGCTSQMSALKNVVLSDFTNLSWLQNPTPVTFGDSKVYEVSATNGPVTYNWTVSGGATITTGQGTSKVLVQFPASGSGTMTVGVNATNACGSALNNSAFAGNQVTVNSACPTVVITAPTTAQTINTVTGQQVNLSITAANTNNPAYVWTDGSTTVGNAASINITAASGTKTYTCTVTNGCGGAGVTSVVFTVIAAKDPASNPTGTGTLTGKTSFDINQSNDNANGCGTLSSRAASAVNFNNTSPTQDNAATGPFTASQVYTFKPNQAVTNVRFQYVESISGKIVQSVTPNADYSGSVASGAACKATILYQSSLMIDAKGLTTAQALTATIYAVYTVGGTDYSVKLTARIADCGGCGAYVAAGQWKDFMCWNLGADQSADPFTPAQALYGNYYQWGRKAPVANVSTPAGAISGWNTTAAPDGSWADATKTANDPCPAGYRVPTSAQWQGVVNTSLNAFTAVGTFNGSATNYGSGVRFGTRLYIPNTGLRAPSNGLFQTTGSNGPWIQSSTIYGTGSYYLWFGASQAGVGSYSDPAYRTAGEAIRCVAE